jgi:alkylated DNA repair dioxygenase AlkB
MTQDTAPARRAPRAPPEGWRYEAEFLDLAQERSLLQTLGELPFQAARYKEWTARRRIVSYGGRYDFNRNVLEPAAAIPAVFEPLRQRAAEWAGVPATQLSHATVAEYPPATPLGWHRDVPEFELVVGVSLGGHARMRFRPYPHEKGGRTVFAIDLEPRSVYLLRGAVRWNWQHAISETKELRYSITFRSRRKVG